MCPSTIMKAIIVSRVSTEEQREAGNSLPAQTARMEGYFERNGYTVIERFSFDESAYKTKRDEFDKIIDFINRAKEKIAVGFDKVDRLSRNIFDKRVSLLYEKAVNDEIELHFVSDGQVINNKMSAGDKFAFGMKLGLSKYYSDAISDNVKRANEQKRRNGEWTGKVRIGYKNITDENEKKIVIVDQERQHIIVKMFEIYATGNQSYESIKKIVDDMGLKSLNGKPLSKSSIENILKDPFYCGTAISKIYGSYTHKYPRLITRELFDKCQEVREGKVKHLQKVVSKDFIFRGLVTCENCGCSVTPELKTKKSGKKFTYYSCTNSKRTCQRLYVPEKELLEPVYKVLESFERISEETQNTLVKELRESTEAEVAFHKAQINRIRTEYENLKQKDDRLLEAYLEQSITKEIYDKKHQEYHDKLQLLNLELEEHTKADFDYQTTVASVLNVARRAKAIFESSEVHEKRSFLNYLFQNSTLKERKLDLKLRSPFNLVLELSSSPLWLPLLDKFRTLNWDKIKLDFDLLGSLLNRNFYELNQSFAL